MASNRLIRTSCSLGRPLSSTPGFAVLGAVSIGVLVTLRFYPKASAQELSTPIPASETSGLPVLASQPALSELTAKQAGMVQPLSAAQALRLRDLDNRPIHQMANKDLADYLQFRTTALATDANRPSAAEAVGQFARRSVGQAYRLNAVQHDLAEGDCVSFVNRTLAMSLAKDWNSYFILTERIRHKGGIVDYKNRNFFTLGDWLPNNAWLLQDITADLGRVGDRPALPFTHVVRPKLFQEFPAAPGSKFTRVVFKGSDYKSPNIAVRTDSYIPAARVPDILPDLRTGDVFLVLRDAPGGHLGCDHMGLIARENDGVTVVHSAPPHVLHEPISIFLTRCDWIAGFKFLRVKSNARDLAAAETTRLSPSVTMPTADATDQNVARLRASRALAAARSGTP